MLFQIIVFFQCCKVHFKLLSQNCMSLLSKYFVVLLNIEDMKGISVCHLFTFIMILCHCMNNFNVFNLVF